jgi:hypothetical protein
MAEQYKCAFDLKVKVDLKDQRTPEELRRWSVFKYPTEEQIIGEAKAVMTSATMNAFQEKMVKEGVTDYTFKGLNIVEAWISEAPKKEHYGILGMQARYVATVTGKVEITFDDILPVAIAGVIAAVAIYLMAHPFLVVLGMAFIAMIITAVAFNATVTTVSDGITQVIDATAAGLYQATQTTGGSIVTIIVAIGITVVAIGITIVALRRFAPQSYNWLKGKLVRIRLPGRRSRI